jgi:hypothetical protein
MSENIAGTAGEMVLMTEDRILKLKAWLESEEGQAALKKVAEAVKAEKKKIEEATKVDPEILKKKMSCF